MKAITLPQLFAAKPSQICKRFVLALAFVSAITAAVAVQAQNDGATTTPTSAAQNAPDGTAQTSVTINWRGFPRVERYRLQLARDKKFADIVFDRAVVGRTYNVIGLEPGKYFWRVAPARRETGAYTRSAPIEIKPDSLTTETASNSQTTNTTTSANNANNSTNNTNVTNANTRALLPSPMPNEGWLAATGEVAQPVAVKLRNGSTGLDLLGVNREGTTTALDGANGVALWAARYRPNLKRGEANEPPAEVFSPLAVRDGQGRSVVIVAYNEGARALDGETGRELWRVRLLPRRLQFAEAFAGSDEAASKIMLVANEASDTDAKPTAYFIDAVNGRVLQEIKLPAKVVGLAMSGAGDNARIVVALENGALEVRDATGKVVQQAKLDVKWTTTPLAIKVKDQSLLLIGSEGGLVAFNFDTLRALWRVATEPDVPVGKLVQSDLDADGIVEVALVTARHRLVIVNPSDGKIRWFADVAADAGTPAFRDLDGDGTQDVIVAAGTEFVSAHSGRNGKLLWRVEETRGKTANTPAESGSAPRSFALATASNGQTVLVGSDAARRNLRAVSLPKTAASR